MRWIALQACTTEPGPLRLDAVTTQRAVASLTLSFTPRVVLLDEAVLLDVTASLRLFGGLRRLLALLKQRLNLFFESNQVLAQVNIAYGATSLIALGKLRHPVDGRAGDLPMHTLSAVRPHLDVLERTGCRSWDDLLGLPRDGVARRFGAPLLAALDRARGSVPDSYDWLVLPEQFEEKLELDALVIHGPALMTGVQRLMVGLQAWLLGRQRGLCALKITWHLDKRRDVLPTGELVVRTDQPAQDLAHVTRLVAEHLSRQALAAPVHSLTLQSLVTEPLVDAAAATSSLLIEDRQSGGCSALELIERLSARLGDDHVQVWQSCADHRPEHMQRWVPAKTALNSIAAQAINAWAKGKNDQKKARPSALKPSPSAVDALYPRWLLPQPLALQTQGNRPVYQGPLQRLTGPQRLESCGWWMDGECAVGGAINPDAPRARPPAIRDYFIYRSAVAGLLWIYSERLTADDTHTDAPPQHVWFLHGFFA